MLGLGASFFHVTRNSRFGVLTGKRTTLCPVDLSLCVFGDLFMHFGAVSGRHSAPESMNRIN